MQDQRSRKQHDYEPDTPIQEEALLFHDYTSGQDSAEPQERREIEKVRAQDDTEADLVMATLHGHAGRGDFRGICPQGS